jgi:hypothetical protein
MAATAGAITADSPFSCSTSELQHTEILRTSKPVRFSGLPVRVILIYLVTVPTAELGIPGAEVFC